MSSGYSIGIDKADPATKDVSVAQPIAPTADALPEPEACELTDQADPDEVPKG